jgi:ADP-heptose:LPS heptosyltransferase
LHPGMGGSALNWPQENYAKLAIELVKKNKALLFTGSVFERPLLEVLQKTVLNETGQQIAAFTGELSSQSLKELIALYSLAGIVIAPSTGPLHIAVALGKSTVSFYPSIKVQSAKRWGPYFHKNSSQNQHFVLSPIEDIKVGDGLEYVLKIESETA